MAIAVIFIIIALVIAIGAVVFVLADDSPEAKAMRNAAKGASSDLAHQVRSAKLRADLDRIEREDL